MLLTIDVGNTNMVFAIFRGEEMIGSFRLRTDGQATSDEIGLMASEYFLRFGLEPKQVEDVVIDAISRECVYLGGTIGTGLRVTMDALTARAAMLPRVELAMPKQALGMNTVTQMQAGVVAGYVGNIEYLVSRIRREMNEPYAHVVATGGLSKLVAQETDCIDIQDSFLILDGLRAMYQRRQEA